MTSIPPFRELIAATERSAIHLEMREAYTPGDPRFLKWKAGEPVQQPANPGWVDLVRAHVARGVRFRRARIVSEPVTDYIRFEHEITPGVNIAAGEHVRWLPRRLASDLALPGNDFWAFDERIVRFHHFSGVGEIIDDELVADSGTVRMCVSAFETVWERATDHERYQPF